MILALFFFSYSCISTSYVSWLFWISDLVPDDYRGRFFGVRNMLSGAAETYWPNSKTISPHHPTSLENEAILSAIYSKLLETEKEKIVPGPSEHYILHTFPLKNLLPHTVVIPLESDINSSAMYT